MCVLHKEGGNVCYTHNAAHFKYTVFGLMLNCYCRRCVSRLHARSKLMTNLKILCEKILEKDIRSVENICLLGGGNSLWRSKRDSISHMLRVAHAYLIRCRLWVCNNFLGLTLLPSPPSLGTNIYSEHKKYMFEWAAGKMSRVC